MAYDRMTGKLAWKSADATGSWAPLVVVRLDGRDVLAAWHSGGLKGLDPASGTELWNIPWRTAYDCHATAPATEGSCLFLTSGYGAGCRAFEIKDSKPLPLWEMSKAIASCNSDPVIHEGFVYSFSGNGPEGSLKCIELKSGIQKWETKELGNGTLLLVDGCLLCLSYKGDLALVEAQPSAFRMLGRMKLFSANSQQPAYAAPAIAGRYVLARHASKLVCLALAEGPGM
jgi:outer membrane protein assembly factor BamB